MASTNGSPSALKAQRQAVTDEIEASLREETSALLGKLSLNDLMVLNYQAKQMAGGGGGIALEDGETEPRLAAVPGRYTQLASEALKTTPGGLSTEALGSQLYGKDDPDRAKKARSVLQYLRKKGGASVRNGLWFGTGSGGSGARKVRGMDAESVPSLVLQAIKDANRPVKSGDIIAAVRSAQPELAQMKINGAIYKLAKQGKIKRRGPKGNSKYFMPPTNGGAA